MKNLLASGRPIDFTIASGQTLSFTAKMEKGQFAVLRVFQRAVDLTVEVVPPNAGAGICVDGYSHGPEIACWTSDLDGLHDVHVRANSGTGDSVKCQLSWTLRAREAADDLRMEASFSATAAKQLLKEENEKHLLEALTGYEEILEVWDRIGERESAAATLVSIGLIHVRLGNLRGAETSFRAALGLFSQLGDKYGEAAMLANLGSVQFQLGDLAVFPTLEDALEAFRALDADQSTASVLNTLGAVYTATGEWNTALSRYEDARIYAERAGSIEGMAHVATNVGVISIALGDYGKAEETLETAVALFQQIKALAQQARALMHLGQLYLKQDRIGEARDCADRANAIIPPGTGSKVESDLLRLQGEVARHSGSAEAIDLHVRSADAARRAGRRSAEAQALHFASMACRAHKQTDRAIEFLQQSLEIARSIGLKDAQAAILYTLAQVHLEIQAFSEALAFSEEAADLVDELRTRAFGPELRATYFASRHDYWHLPIHIVMESKSQGYSLHEQAFNTLERGRARSLLDILDESWQSLHTDINGELVPAIRDIIRKLRLLCRQQSDDSASYDAAAREHLDRQIEDLQLKKRQAEERILGPNVSAKSLSPEPLNLSSIRSSVLDDETTLIQFALGEPCSYAWVISRDLMRPFRLASRTVIEKAAREAHQWLQTWPKRKRNPRQEELYGPLETLSKLILEPIVPALRSRRLLVTAEGWLLYIPLGALRKPGLSHPLCSEHEVIYAPSASTIAALRKQRARKTSLPNQRILVLADPVFQPTALESPAYGRRVAPLPFTREEALTIQRLAQPGETLLALDYDASREFLQTTDLEQFRILHFGTHAFVNDRYPELSNIVLSRVEKNGAPVDGYFNLLEIYNLRLRAETVVLAACSTALGQEVRGEGLIGLVRAFMYAGASSVLATLWDIDDQAASIFMEHYYSSLLRDKARPAEALRIAQTRMSEDRNWHWPHFWAGFAHIGDWETYR